MLTIYCFHRVIFGKLHLNQLGVVWSLLITKQVHKEPTTIEKLIKMYCPPFIIHTVDNKTWNSILTTKLVNVHGFPSEIWMNQLTKMNHILKYVIREKTIQDDMIH